MDNFDNHSNVSDDCSRSQSNLSSLSGLTGYELEVSNLQHILNTDERIKCDKSFDLPKVNQSDILILEDRIKNLSSELQNCLKSNEKYKNEIFNLEHKSELTQHSKFEKLVRENAQLHVQLDNANNYIKKLLPANTSKENTKASILELRNNVIHLERSNYEKNLLIQAKENDAKQWKSEYEQLKMKVNSNEGELKLDLETKTSCIKELKKKIAEQHVQYQQLLLENSQINNNFKSIKNNFEHSTKSEAWYKEQLYSSQTEKSNLHKELTETKSLLVNKDLHIQKLNLEIEKSKTRIQNLECDGIKEKEHLLKKIDVINKELLKIGSKDYNYNLIQTPVIIEDSLTTDELKKDMELLQQNMGELYSVLNETNKKKADLETQNTILHKDLTEKLLALENVEKHHNETQTKLNNCLKQLKQHENENLILTNAKSKLEIALSLANNEKSDIDNSIIDIKKVFNKFMAVHKSIKDELAKKSRELLKLQNEKQQLFMNNNWHVCEMEDAKKQIEENVKRNQTLTEENSKLICELYNLKSINNNLKRDSGRIEHKLLTVEEENIKLLTDLKVVQDANKSQDTSILADVLQFISDQLFGLTNKSTCNPLGSFLTQNNYNFDANLIQNCDRQFDAIGKRLNDSSNQIQTLLEQKKVLQKQLTKLQKNLITKMNNVAARVPDLEMSLQKSYDVLKAFNRNNLDANALEEIKTLRAVIKVKELEIKDKAKRYNVNTHTLLKKVKEHLRGRNAAEKQIVAIKQLYENACEELNSLKFDSNNKTFEMLQLQNNISNTEYVNKKLQESVISLESQLAAITNCEKCADAQNIIQQHNINETRILRYEEDLNEKTSAIESLNNMLQANHFKVLRQEDEINTYKVEQQSLHQQLTEHRKTIAEYELAQELTSTTSNNYQHQLFLLQNSHGKCKFVIDDLQQNVTDLNEKHAVYLKEIDFLNNTLTEKTKEIDLIKMQKQEMNASIQEKDNNHELLLNKLKIELVTIQENLQITRNDKLFLERLNNDMKVALQTLSHQNKILTRPSSKEFRSIPSDLLNLPSPNKLDDNFITKLLQSCNERPKPLTELQSCLNSLKQEMSSLQDEIIQKSFITFNS